MYDRCLVADILRQVAWSLDQIAKRFSVIHASADFIKDDQGREKLDSICMQLIAIGEALKLIDKIAGSIFLAAYPSVDWKKAKGLRDIITHHYFDIDAEAVFTVCSEHLPQMQTVIRLIIADLEVQ